MARARRSAAEARWVAPGFLLWPGDPVGVAGVRGVFQFVVDRDAETVDLWGPVSPDPARARARSVRTAQLRVPSRAEMSTYAALVRSGAVRPDRHATARGDVGRGDGARRGP